MSEQGVVMKLIAIKPEQHEALRHLRSKYGIVQTRVIREGIDLALARYSHLLPLTSAVQTGAKRELSE